MTHFFIDTTPFTPIIRDFQWSGLAFEQSVNRIARATQPDPIDSWEGLHPTLWQIYHVAGMTRREVYDFVMSKHDWCHYPEDLDACRL